MHRLPLVAATAALTLAGCGSSADKKPTASTAASTPASAAAAGGPVKIELSEWAVDASAATAKAGKVSFAIHNAGKIKHEFVVLKTTKAAGKLGTGSRVSEAGNVGESGDIPAGATKSVSLKLKPGHYSFVCNLPAHYMSGMHTDFTVQ